MSFLLRRGTASPEWEAVGHGMLIVTESQAGALLVNGQELRPREEESGVGLLTAIYYPRQAFAGQDVRHRPAAGDIVGLQVRHDLIAAYEVRVAGPGSNPGAEGVLEPDGIACEFRPDLGSLHRLVQGLRALADPQLH